VLFLAIGAMLTMYLRYGGGDAYPDLSTEPLISADELEIVVRYPEPIGNVAVSGDGRVFFTVHPESRPSGWKLIEWQDGEPRAYPDAASQNLFETVLGVVIDRQNRLWTIDHGNHGLGSARLLAFDLDTGEVVHDHRFSRKVAQFGSFLQDLQVDSSGSTVYIADVSFWRRNPAIIVYDVEAHDARRILESHPSVFPQDWLIRTPIRTMAFFGGLVTLKPGIDGIALDKQDEWLYYGAMTHDGLFRVPTAILKDRELDDTERAEHVERVSEKPLSDGLSIDRDGNVYITDVEHGAVAMVDTEGKLTTLVRSPEIRWADALSFGPRRWLYIADSALPDQMLMPRTHIAAKGPYHVFRVRVANQGIPGQ
jgi:sugar lactone lactonase YvrE